MTGWLIWLIAAAVCAVILFVAVIVGVVAIGLFHAWREPRSYPSVPPTVIDPRLLWSAKRMSAALARGDFSSEEIVGVHIDHLVAVNPFLNATVHTRFQQARDEAKRADELLRSARTTGDWSGIGWLTGVPISVKECFAVQGCPNTSGHVARKNMPATVDAPTVTLLKDAGAVILGVTNTSELCMWMESRNPVHGLTKNAYDTSRIVGGSSGGEACAVSALFTPVGLGSDIGGSIRMPAYFNGVFGHKPSTRLVTNRGQHPGCFTKGHFLLTTGPITRHASDLYPMMKTLTQVPFGEDPTVFAPCPPLRDPAGVNVSRLRVYCMDDLGVRLTRASPEQRMACRHAAEGLAAKYGATVKYVDFADPSTVPPGWDNFRYVFDYWSTLMAFSGERTFTNFMGDGYPDNQFPLLAELLRIPFQTNRHTLPAIGLCLLEKLTAAQPKFMIDNAYKRGDALRKALDAELGDDGVLLVPTYPDPVPQHNQPLLPPIKWVYTAAFNALQNPATAAPVWLSENQTTPLGVQCVARWSRDDISIATAQALEEAIGGYRPPRWVRYQRE